MRSFVLFFAFLCTASIGRAQLSEEPKHEVLTKINLPGLIDPTTPSLQFCLEYRYKNRWGAELTIGPGFYLFYPAKNRDSIYHHSLKYKGALKYYAWKQAFAGVEYIRSSMARNKFNGHFQDSKGNSFTYQEAEIRRDYHAMVFKGGGMFSIGPRLFLELSAGFGLKIVETSVTGLHGEQPSAYFNPLLIDAPAAVTGHQIKPHLVSDLKLGIRLF